MKMQAKAGEIAVDLYNFRLYYVDFCNVYVISINFDASLIFCLFMLLKTVLDLKILFKFYHSYNVGNLQNGLQGLFGRIYKFSFLSEIYFSMKATSRYTVSCEYQECIKEYGSYNSLLLNQKNTKC